MGTIRNAYKFVVGQPSDLDAKGMKTAVKQRNVKEYTGFNSLGIWSSVTISFPRSILLHSDGVQNSVFLQNDVPEIWPPSLVPMVLYTANTLSF